MNRSLGLMASDALPQALAADDCAVYPDVRSLPADAQQLLQSTGQLDFQNSMAWYDNFVHNVEPLAGQPEFHIWRPGGQTRLLLPLQVQREGNASTVSALGNYYTTRWAPLRAAGLADAQVAIGLDHILSALLKRQGPVHTLRLGPLEAGSTDEALLRAALRRSGCAVFDLHAFQNWLLPVTVDWPTYLAGRDGKLRTTLSRMGRRFAARGGRLELLQGGPGLERAIAAYQAVYAASWKQPEPHPRFMPGLIRAASEQGQLRMAVAWLGEQPVAAQVWMVAGGRADIYKLAHDEQHKETSPGTLLTALLMKHCFEVDRVQWVDYLSGDDGYKRLWMSEVRERRSLLACNLRTVRGLALAGREVAVRGIKSVLRKPSAQQLP